MKRILFLFFCLLFFSACSSSRYSVVDKKKSFDNYKYVFVNETNSISTSSGGIYGSDYGLYGSTRTVSVIPSDIIAGYMLKRSFIRVYSLDDATIDRTFIVSYGESGRYEHLFNHSTEVTIQFLDASTNDVIATTTAAARGSNDTDNIKNAIVKSLDNLFGKLTSRWEE